MTINSLLNHHHIHLNQDLQTQKDVFHHIADVAVRQGIATSEEDVVNGLLAREQESTTGFQDGFAIPHTQVDAIQHPGIIIVSTQNGVAWQSLDEQPATFFIALLIPENNAGTMHLTLLSSISRILMHEDVRDTLATAQSAEQVMQPFETALEGVVQ